MTSMQLTFTLSCQLAMLNVVITSRKSDLQILGMAVVVDDIDEDKSANIEDLKQEGKH